MTYISEQKFGSLPLAGDPSASDSATSATSGSIKTHAVTPPITTTKQAIEEIASDSAKVSMAGSMLSQAASGSDVRFEKVAALRQSIEAGTYDATPADVASRLVDHMRK